MRAILGLLFAAAGLAQTGPAVSVKFFHDEDRSSLSLGEIAFSSPERGVVLGISDSEKDGTRPVALVTSNGGVNWTPVRLKKPGISLFLLDDSHYWMVATDGVWFSAEGGREWKKLSNPKGALRVHFLNAATGFAVGTRKQVWKTDDGGSKWTPVAAAQNAKGDPDITAFTYIAFADDRNGIITGHVRPKRRRQDDRELPAWVDPEAASRRVVPQVEISMETKDAGATWTTSAASLFGEITHIRMSPLGWGLGLLRFKEGFEYPSEVYRLNWKAGTNERIYRDKSFLVTDLVMTDPGGPAYLVGVEQQGPLINSPVARRVRVLASGSLKSWKELEVDFRASATNVRAATAGGKLWLSTDSGMILTLR
jgi:hypothetical protein